MATSRWTMRPPGSTWGDFGEDDQLGRLNLLTQKKIEEGFREVAAFRTFCLSLPLDYPGGNALVPRRFPPVLSPVQRGGRPFMNYPFALEDPRYVDVGCDDYVTLYLQYSTQWDALAHVGSMFDVSGDGTPEMVYYNGFRAGSDVVGPDDDKAGPSGARRLGIENVAAQCVQGRAVMIDLEHHFGREKRNVGFDDLMRVIDADKLEIEPGDMVCLRTGYADVVLSFAKKPDPAVLQNTCAALDGSDVRLQQWVTDSGIVALFADNFAVERLPAPNAAESTCCEAAPLHQHCLFRLGVYLGELWYLSELADWLRLHRRSRFLLTAPPLRLPGAVGSPVTPVATV